MNSFGQRTPMLKGKIPSPDSVEVLSVSDLRDDRSSGKILKAGKIDCNAELAFSGWLNALPKHSVNNLIRLQH